MKKLYLITFCIVALMGCQTVPTITPVQSHQSQDGKKLLEKSIYQTLRQNQDFIAEMQIHFPKNNPLKEPVYACFDDNKQQLLQQMRQDKIEDYQQVKDLTEKQQQAYAVIHQNLLACYETHKDKHSEMQLDILLYSILSIGKEHQISDLYYLTDNAKLTITGNYRPSQKRVAMQFDAGLENKNLKLHYRLPVVLDSNKQTLYIKPDAIMPMISIFADNQLGMSWQDKWYQLTVDNKNKDYFNLNKKAWLAAVKDGLMDLPKEQFRLVNADDIQPKIYHSKQKMVNHDAIVRWQPTKKQLQTFIQEVTNQYIYQMDDLIENDQSKQKLTHQQRWQIRKEILVNKLERQWVIDDKNNPNEDRQTAFSVDFVIVSNQIKQIYLNMPKSMKDIKFEVTTWLTINPDETILPKAYQPSQLQQLTDTLRPNGKHLNVIDIKEEFNRLKQLDKSRSILNVVRTASDKYAEYIEKSKVISNVDSWQDDETNDEYDDSDDGETME